MKTMLLAAATAVSLGIGSAYAASSGSDTPMLPDVVAQAPAQNAPTVAPPRGLSATVQPGHSPWLFPPIGKYLDQHAS